MYKWGIENWQYIYLSSEQAMKSHVLHTVWCNISAEALQGKFEIARDRKWRVKHNFWLPWQSVHWVGSLPLTTVSEDSLPLTTVSEDSLPLTTVSDSLPLTTVSEGSLPLTTVSEDSLPLTTVSEGSLPLTTVSEDSLPLTTVWGFPATHHCIWGSSGSPWAADPSSCPRVSSLQPSLRHRLVAAPL